MKRKDETDKKECPKQRKVPEPEKLKAIPELNENESYDEYEDTRN